MAKSVIIVGGGISGLSAAYRLKKSAPELDVTVFEANARCGGNIGTERMTLAGHGELVIEAGPDSWVAQKKETRALSEELGLGPELIETIPENRRVYLAWNGSLRPMPDGLVLGIPTELPPFLRSSLFGKRAKARVLLDLVLPRRTDGVDESVGQFLSRRFGAAATNTLIAPLLGGIFAGDAYELSVRAAFPQFVEGERKYGSVIRAMRAVAKERKGAASGAFLSLRRGMGSLLDALISNLPAGTVKNNVQVTRIRREGTGYIVETSAGEKRADSVLLTGPTRSSARLLGGIDAPLATMVSDLMEYASTAIVTLAYPRANVDHPLDATGFIVPRTSADEIVAATFNSSKWPHRAPESVALVRAFLGGHGRAHIVQKENEALEGMAHRGLSKFLGIRGEPLLIRTVRYADRSPQPRPGHEARVENLRKALEYTPGIYLTASGILGVGISDCIREANRLAEQILAR